MLLLDEILAELDVERRQDLLETLAECEQSVLTTTDLGLFGDEFLTNTTIWKVKDGRVEK